MKLSPQQVTDFQETVWEYFRAHMRTMPWRENTDAYNVLVSELMLQQTQVPRVVPKFEEFMTRFPTIKVLADAPLSEVLIAWNGLGYNRRAKFLHEAAKKIVHEYSGEVPDSLEALLTLPGIGRNTAGAILAYAYNRPVAFIETNIRSVLFHHFFDDDHHIISDKELAELAAQIIDHDSPREWHWALMDYGAHLKKTAGARLASSKHYKKQSPLKGSLREMRGNILKALTISGSVVESQLRVAVQADERYTAALSGLINEGMVTQHKEVISLTGHTDAR